ncbi:MAG: aminoglycoside phosphotransferase family protein [Gammaproteobacteria bacterium]|jgi:aminoglycoside phosphotransferase|nr:aminoglycoside phosphotransferase family protein [Gammaproteobacteria bacterium]
MKGSKNIRNNLRFLIAEVGSQVSNLQDYLDGPSASVGRRILDRSGYAYNLMLRIHDSCHHQVIKAAGSGADAASLRAIESIATDLERITGLCREAIQQLEQLQNRRCPGASRCISMLDNISGGLDRVEPAIHQNDTRLALKIGQIKPRLDKASRRLVEKYTAGLKRKKHTEDLVSGLFLVHGIEQMGDAMLNISEAIISANLGQPINIDRYQSLRASMQQLHTEGEHAGLVVEPVAETRSGSGISAISASGQEDAGYVAIYKDGKKRKLREERRGLESWQEIFPGLAPRILSYHKRGQSASLLIEHVAGLTFEQILLHEPATLLRQTQQQLQRTLGKIWHETRTRKTVSAGYMRQLSRRLEEVYTIHPEFHQQGCRICAKSIPSFGALLKQAHGLEARLSAPFSVYIHGDFNVDNIIYDPLEKKINFIDLHRSRYMDYVQDVSVFMVSNYRLQIFDAPLRARILMLTREFYRFAAAFARKAGDPTFELRLALGLARSFATSTRFILDKSLARAMFLRSRYLLEQVLTADLKEPALFRVPVKEIFIG